MNNLEKFIPSADLMRTISIVAIVLLHVSAASLLAQKVGSPDWWISDIYNSFTRFAVPLFVMISGMLLLGKTDEGIGTFFKKRVCKIAIPLAAWSFFYYVFFFFFKTKYNTLDPVFFLKTVISKPITGHLWFLYMIIGLYLTVPIMRPFIHHSSKTSILYFVVAWFLFSVLFNTFDINIGFHNMIFNIYLGYFILGYFLKNIRFRYEVGISSILFLLSWGATALLTYAASKGGKTNEIFYEASKLNVAIMTISMYFICKGLDDRLRLLPEKRLYLLRITSTLSFGVYLIHQMFNNLESNVIHNYYIPYLALSIPLKTIVVCFLSFSIVYILKKFIIIKSLFP